MEQIVRRAPSPDPATPQNRPYCCAFTGYRLQKLPFSFDERDPRFLSLSRRLYAEVEMLILEGYTHFISGGAIGFDLLAAEAVLSLRKRYPWGVLEVAIPCDGQDTLWDPAWRSRRQCVLREADIITRTGREYTPRVMQTRNEYMVQRADLLMACYDGQRGGTENTLRYAERLGRHIIVLPPTAPLLKAG